MSSKSPNKPMRCLMPKSTKADLAYWSQQRGVSLSVLARSALAAAFDLALAGRGSRLFLAVVVEAAAGRIIARCDAGTGLGPTEATLYLPDDRALWAFYDAADHLGIRRQHVVGFILGGSDLGTIELVD